MPDDTTDEGWEAEEPGSDASSVPHDDIMKRLLDYQRSLREGASPEEAAEIIARAAEPQAVAETAVVTEDVVELEEPAAEPSAEPAGPSAEGAEPEPAFAEPEPAEPEVQPWERGDVAPAEQVAPEVSSPPPSASRVEVEERLARLEGTLDRLESKLGALRRTFQDMAVVADERLATLEEEVAQARGAPEEGREPAEE